MPRTGWCRTSEALAAKLRVGKEAAAFWRRRGSPSRRPGVRARGDYRNASVKALRARAERPGADTRPASSSATPIRNHGPVAALDRPTVAQSKREGRAAIVVSKKRTY